MNAIGLHRKNKYPAVFRSSNVVNMGRMLVGFGVERVRTRSGSAYRVIPVWQLWQMGSLHSDYLPQFVIDTQKLTALLQMLQSDRTIFVSVFIFEIIILILMDYSLRIYGKVYKKTAWEVLILILMDYSLRILILIITQEWTCLNPYSNGLLSENTGIRWTVKTLCLNPYSNGLLSENSDRECFTFSSFFSFYRNPYCFSES